MTLTADEPEDAARRHLSPSPSAVAGGVGGSGASEAVIDVSSSDTESDSGGGKRSRVAAGRAGRAEKRARVLAAGAAVPPGFLDPLMPVPLPSPPVRSVTRQFWKAGDYGGKRQLLGSDPAQHFDSGMEHIRVHPRFLHSNATSHKWALGAIAELLDNSLDEVSNGATYVNIDMLENKKDQTQMLLVQDDGGGMDPDKMRHCMSLGYSTKSKVKNTIGQYGNGFKTSTMRLGADVLVFSRNRGNEERRSTQSVGMISYTFLKSTGKDDIIVPMIDYEKGKAWKRKVRTTLGDWLTNLQMIIQWSPYSTEAELLREFSSINEQGTRIIIYNLWEDEQEELELDFDADVNDIQIRGANRDQNDIQLAKQYPNSKHFFMYRHSLRSYASILYLRVPYFFRMILRGKEIEQHNIVNDMMLKKQVTYKPAIGNGCPSDTDMVADVIIGFVKDAKHHIAVQGFNVYHKNRLIKPFWRVWNLPGSQGRGIIGVLEVNFIEPAHDKQDFERTNNLSRLEARLVVMQKKYWSDNCHQIGYGHDHANKSSGKEKRGPSSHLSAKGCGKSEHLAKSQCAEISCSGSSNKNRKTRMSLLEIAKQVSSRTITPQKAEKSPRIIGSVRSVRCGLSYTSDGSDTEIAGTPSRSTSHYVKAPVRTCHENNTIFPSPPSSGVIRTQRMTTRSRSKEATAITSGGEGTIDDPETVIMQLKDENSSLKECIFKLEESLSKELEIERDKNKSLTERVENAQAQLEAANKEQEALTDIFSEESSRLRQSGGKFKNEAKGGILHHTRPDEAAECSYELQRELNWNADGSSTPMIYVDQFQSCCVICIYIYCGRYSFRPVSRVDSRSICLFTSSAMPMMAGQV